MRQYDSCLLRYRPYSFHSQPNTKNTNCSKLNIPYNNLLAHEWVHLYVLFSRKNKWCGWKEWSVKTTDFHCLITTSLVILLIMCGMLLPEQSSVHQKNNNQLGQTRTLMVVTVLYSQSNVDLITLSTWYPSSPGSPRSPCAPGGPCVDTNARTWTHILYMHAFTHNHKTSIELDSYLNSESLLANTHETCSSGLTFESGSLLESNGKA